MDRRYLESRPWLRQDQSWGQALLMRRRLLSGFAVFWQEVHYRKIEKLAVSLSEVVTWSPETQFSVGDGMKLSRCLVAFIVSLFCVNVFWAQSAPAPKAVVIRAGHLLDVKTGKTLTNQTILIPGDKIAGVASDTQVPAGAQVVDLSNATVLPGLIDAHTHITMTTNFGYSRLPTSSPPHALTPPPPPRAPPQ